MAVALGSRMDAEGGQSRLAVRCETDSAPCNTHQHLGRRDWWQREASPLRVEVSAGTPPWHHQSQGATSAGRPIRQNQPQSLSAPGPRQLHLLTHPQQSREQQRSWVGPRAEHVGNLGALGSACPEYVRNLPAGAEPPKGHPRSSYSFHYSHKTVKLIAVFSAFSLAKRFRRTGSSRRAEAD